MVAQGRNEMIDGVRGVAIATVLFYHYCFAWQRALGLPPTPAWLQLGALGVQLFFVVSGLVIAMTLLRSQDAARFALRRAARLVPAFWVAATLVYLSLTLADPLRFAPTAADWLASLTFAPQELGRDYVDGAFWSLNIEVKFYLLAALSFAALRERFWIGLAGYAWLGSAMRLVTDAGQRSLFLGPYLPFFLVGLAFWFAFFAPDRAAARTCLVTALACHLLHADFYVLPGLPLWLPHAWLALAIGGFAVLLARTPDMRAGALAWLGRRSYSLYLVHQRLGVTLIALLLGAGVAAPAAVALATIAAVTLATALYRWVELPGQALLLRLFEPGTRPHVLRPGKGAHG